MKNTKNVRFLVPVTIEGYDGDDDDSIERNFVKGEVVKARITRETPHVFDMEIYGTCFYGISKTEATLED